MLNCPAGGLAGVNPPGGPVQKQIDDKVIVAIGDTSLRGCDTSKTTTHLSFIEWQFPKPCISTTYFCFTLLLFLGLSSYRIVYLVVLIVLE